MASRYAVKSATFKFGSKSYDMETGPAMKAETKEAVETTALSDTIKQFIPGALKEVDEFTVPLYMKGTADDLKVDDAPAAVEIEVSLENGEAQDITGLKVQYNKCIITKVAPSQIQASSDRKALYDVTFRPDGSVAAQSGGGSGGGSGSGSGQST